MESIEKEKVILTVPKFIFSDDGFSQKWHNSSVGEARWQLYNIVSWLCVTLGKRHVRQLNSRKGASMDRDPAGELEEIQTISGTDRLWLFTPTTVYHQSQPIHWYSYVGGGTRAAQISAIVNPPL